MARAGGGLGAWGPLMLLVLCSRTWDRAAALGPVRNLTVGAQTNNSITLVWEAPEGPDSQDLTYWVQCTGDGGSTETQNTTSTSATVGGLDAATPYACSVWAEQDGASGTKEDLTVSTAPNAVRNLTVGARTNSSLTLVWEAPEGPDSQDLTYWVQCTGDGGSTETQNTTSTSATVDGLDAATPYACSVWAEQDGASGTKEDLTVSTAPNAVRNLTVGAQTNNSITLVWEAPEGPDSQDLTYWVQCTGDGGSTETQNTTSTSATVGGLDAATPYACSVWAEQDGASSTKEDLTVSTAPNAVRNLTVGARTNSSLTLVWEAPEGPDSQDLTYWVQCTGDGGSTETQNTTSTSATVGGLDAATPYACSVWAEQDGASSTKEDLTVSTAPNAVRNLTVGARTNSSLTLVWEAPEGPDSQDLTYWVQCTGDGGSTETQNTTSTSATVDGLDAGSTYELRVWVKQNGVSSSQETRNVSTGEQQRVPSS
nr:receptor-type tyrosine-protein phosphatase H isoform X2 [Oryctolagus cuniculus]XP_051683884.1 receptor-type tyrosine-protein phosphatase H isoform X2 [Oryctolagus cuniculus]XP_051683885.1 receptor-type tyrosine-protein phosphatase H isoform X2 [Oryctolagus cuniculus]